MRVNKKNLIFPFIVMVLMVLLLIFIPFKKVLSPHKAGTVDEVISLYEAGERFAEVSLDEIRYTGYDFCNNNGECQAKYYYALSAENGIKCTFFLVPAGSDGETEEIISGYRAKVRLISDDGKINDFLEAFATDMNWELTDIKEISLGFIASEYDYKPFIVILIGIIAGLTFLVSAVYFIYIIIMLKKKRKLLFAMMSNADEEQSS